MMLMRWKVLKGPLADVALTKSSRLRSQMTHDTYEAWYSSVCDDHDPQPGDDRHIRRR